MRRTLLLDLVEDAFLSALEDGVNPPREFTVLLPAVAFGQDVTPLEVRVAGYVMTVKAEGLKVIQ